MTSYGDVIERFVYEQFPTIPVGTEARFEAVVAEVIGTKQRRHGPYPSPEVQVAVREYVRDRTELTFFMPWGSSKQRDDAPLDVAELMALKQLACLKDGLARFQVAARFVFRVEDLTDRFLFGDGRLVQIKTYRDSFTALAAHVFGCAARVEPESHFATYPEFEELAQDIVPYFYNHLHDRTPTTLAKLHVIGWKGDLPQAQLDYYYESYRQFYPEANHQMLAARYFAATLARVKLGATAAPAEPHLLIAFTHPVPGNPISKTRLYYRTLPERFSNVHKSPWLARGYFAIDEANGIKPKLANPYEGVELTPHALTIPGGFGQADAVVATPYKLV